MSNHKTVVVIQARIIHKHNYKSEGTTVMYNFVKKNINFYIPEIAIMKFLHACVG